MQRLHILLVIALLLALGGAFMYRYLSPMPMPEYSSPPSVTTGVKEVWQEITAIDAKHYYTEPQNVHTIAGTLLLPKPCERLTNNVVLLDNGTRAVVSFDVVNNSGSDCAEKVTSRKFKIGFLAPKDMKIDAVFKGKPVTLNLTPAGPGEKPADFHLED